MRDREREPFVRAALIVLAVTNPVMRKDIRSIRRSVVKYDMLVAEIGRQASEFSAGDDGPLISIFKWMLENPEAVAQLIAMIMLLFSETDAK